MFLADKKVMPLDCRYIDAKMLAEMKLCILSEG